MADQPGARVLAEIAAERSRQERMWGAQNHPPAAWLGILAAELGEIGEAVTRAGLRGEDDWWPCYRTGLIQLAAVAVAAMEAWDRSSDPRE